MRPPYPPDVAQHLNPRPSPVPQLNLPRIGLYLFLASATTLFTATLFTYVYLRLTPGPTIDASAHTLPPIPRPTLSIPPLLYISTALIFIVAAAAESTRRAANANNKRRAARSAAALLTLGLLFIAIQTPALIQLLDQHHTASQATPAFYSVGPFGLAFFLILIHALHVLGGIVPLAILNTRAARTQLAPNNLKNLATTAAYWHYLDAVWIILFTTLFLTR